MKHELPDLGFSLDALQPHISPETLEFHHGKHHAAYVSKLNDGIQGTDFANASLEEIVRSAEGGVFNNAGQHWNHSFYWDCIRPGGAKKPEGELAKAIARDFGSFDDFKKEFGNQATTLFGSGWAWLVRDASGRLMIEQTANAHTPIEDPAVKAILTCDVWEHAYYIDYRNARPKYVDAFFNVVNWSFVGDQFSS